MGAYLSEPVVEKETESDRGNNGLEYGATSMQGWRINQEDAHNCILKFDDNCALFAVYDGHGGAEVAQYASLRFPEFLKTMSAWGDGRFGQALEDAFLKFDELLTRDDVMDELKMLAGSKKKENEGDDTEEDKALLYEEACLPLEDVLRKYGIAVDRGFLVNSADRRFAPKLKIKREKRPAINKAATEDGNGPPTPPSSPDARSAAAAAAAAISTTTTTSPGRLDGAAKLEQISPNSATEKCDSSAGQEENVETLPMSSPRVADSSKRARFAIKRKSRAASNSNEGGGVDDGERNSNAADSDRAHQDGKNDSCVPTQTNGIGETVDGKLRADSPSEELPHVKRFKDGGGGGAESKKHEKMLADSTTVLDEPNQTPTAAIGKGQALNGSHLGHSDVDSTTDNCKTKTAKSIKENKTVSGGGGGGACDVGSPMMVEEPNSVNRASDEKVANSNKADNKSVAMDESSGASEDDEDEDYNMEVEDEESSEETSESDGIEEDEIVDEQDEMGVDDDDDDEEEAEDDDMFAMPSGDTPGVDSGTTACIALISGATIYVANAGDSRCVLCRGETAVDLSLDHKPEDLTEKRRIELAGGRITGDGRVNGGLNLSRAIGDHFYKRNTELPLREQMISALPDVRREALMPEDRFLILACDGIWNSMNSQDVVDFVRARLAKGMAPAAICEQLCDVCLAPNTIGDGTGCDNMTAIVVLLNRNLTTTDPNPPVASSDEAAAAAIRAEDGSEAEARCT